MRSMVFFFNRNLCFCLAVFVFSGCTQSVEVTSTDEFRLALEASGLPFSTLEAGKVSFAFDSGLYTGHQPSIHTAFDFSRLKFTPMESGDAKKLAGLLVNIESVKYRDGSVCACLFEIDFALNVETSTGEIYSIVVDPDHHHAYLFKAGHLQWGGRLTTASWEKLREALGRKNETDNGAIQG
ncbi:MAG: hypothetical protein KDB01_13405 [Planctomycetaceae bacterium]|nr:hypothetical protein [Planctomycetaceae bacterium]